MRNVAFPCSFLAALWALSRPTAAADRAPDAAEQSRALAVIREYALNYTNRLPDFTCTQVTQRTGFPVMAFKGHPVHDSFEEQITFVGHKESYTVTKVNGEPTANTSHDQITGTHSRGEFGSLLAHTFDPDTGTDFRWERSASQKGQMMYIFAFRVPQAKGYGLIGSRGTVIVAYKGLVYADPQTGAVMRIEMTCEIPKDSEYKILELTLEFRPAAVAGRLFNLPSHYHLHSIKEAPAIAAGKPLINSSRAPLPVLSESTNEADYKAYHRFEADSTVTFGNQAKPTQ